MQGVEKWNAWRSQNPDIFPDLNSANLIRCNLKGANLRDAQLHGAQLNGANLTRAELNYAFMSTASLVHADLTEADLSNAQLDHAILTRAKFIRAILVDADLTRTSALEASFKQSNLTGACIHEWNISPSTCLDDVTCEYINSGYRCDNRRPSNPESTFVPGEFTALIQKTLETIDLIFIDGINWRAFLNSFQELRQRYDDDDLEIQAIERKGKAFVIRLDGSEISDIAAVERQAKVLYEQQRKSLEAQYRTQLDAKEKEIESYRRESASMVEITKLLASRPINVEAIAMADNQSKSTTYNLQGSKFGGGFAAEGGTQIGGTLNDYSITNNLDDIERLLNTISGMVARFPEEQREEAQVELDDLAEEIKTPEKHNPTRFKKRLRGLLAAGTTAAALATGAANFSGDLNETAVNFGEFSDNVIELGERLGVTIEKEQLPQTP